MTTDDGTDDGRVRELVVMTFGPDTLESLRLRVARETSPYLPAAQVGEMVLAVYEVALNSIEHGAGKGIVRVTHTGTELVFDIRDHDGTPTAPTVQSPTTDSSHGRGLWLAQHLSDSIAISAEPDMTSVRLSVRLPTDGH